VVVLIGLIVLTIVLFGTGAADGPLQVALFLSATFAAVFAYKNGHTSAEIEKAAVWGVSSAMGAIFILLAVNRTGSVSRKCRCRSPRNGDAQRPIPGPHPAAPGHRVG